MITAITTATETKLTITTLEELFLEPMVPTSAVPKTKLYVGANTVTVGAGVFKVTSKKGVRITAGAEQFDIAITPNDKDGGPIEFSTLSLPSDVVSFLTDAKAQTPPR